MDFLLGDPTPTHLQLRTSNNNNNNGSSEVAILQRELKDVEKKYFHTKSLLQKNSKKLDAYADELRKLRSRASAQDKELSTKEKMVEKLVIQRNQMESQAIANRDYANKIEHKLAMGAKGQALASRNADLKKQIKSLQEKVETHQRETDAAKLIVEEVTMAKNLLQGALDVRVKEMGLDGNTHTGMLYEIARLKEQKKNLALQVATYSESNADIKSTSNRYVSEIQEFNKTLSILQQRIADSECEILSYQEKQQELQNEKEEMRSERETLLAYVQDLADKNAKTELEAKEVAKKQELEVEAFKEKLRAAEERAVAAENEKKQAIADRTRAQQILSVSEAALGNERGINNKLRETMVKHELNLSSANESNAEVQAKLDEATSVRQTLEEQLSFANNEKSRLNEVIEDLKEQLLEHQHTLSEKSELEHQLKQEMENALKDIELLSSQRNEAKSAMNEAVSISAASLEEQQVMEKTIATQESQIKKLKESKDAVQKAMLTQLSALRQQITLERTGKLENDDLSAISVTMGENKVSDNDSISEAKPKLLQKLRRKSPSAIKSLVGAKKKSSSSKNSYPAGVTEDISLIDLAESEIVTTFPTEN